jgi:serine phosphatase RsbU (regulator of sigma subunit)
MRSTITIRRSLLTSVLTLNLLSMGAILTLLYVGSHFVVSYLATSIIDQTQSTIQMQVQSLFGSVSSELVRLQGWVRLGLVDMDDPDELNRLLDATFREQSQISAVMITTDAGREHMLLRQSDGWQMRRTTTDVDNGHYTFWRWGQSSRKAEIHDEKLDYDPRNRPWFIGAVNRRAMVRKTTTQTDGASFVHWTAPYRFYTTRQPGVTASITATDPQGKMYVIAIDLTLNDISRYTTRMQVGTRGMVMVLAGVDQQLISNVSVIGLPHDARFMEAAQQDQYLLKRPDELKLQVVTDASHVFDQGGHARNRPMRFYSGGEAWWGTGKPQQLGDDLHVAVAILVPESDIMGGIAWVQRGVWMLLLVILAGSIYHVVRLARRFSAPMECLVQDMRRVSRGVLDQPCRVKSDVREFTALASAHENMRQSLQALLKLEHDMQLARVIQQKTFPDVLPRMTGFEIDAWSQPADDTGGDSYDVIGLRSDTSFPGQYLIDDQQLDKCLFLLADATGHGIGPALSVTQLRSMLRMSVWTNVLDIQTIQHINEQFMRDLPEGRFVTAWLGSLDVSRGELMSFSAGQGPLMHYHAKTDSFEILDADTPPLGVVSPLELENRNIITLQRGDLFIVFSDGIYEARTHGGDMFGMARVQQILRDNAHASAPQITAAIRQAVNTFTEGCKKQDDQTVVLIKRV